MVLDLSYFIENYGFRNLLILLLVAEGKFVKCSSVCVCVCVYVCVCIYIYIYRYIGCFFFRI